MIKGAEHMLKSTEWKKKTKKKDCHQASAQTKVWGYVCPANRELISYLLHVSTCIHAYYSHLRFMYLHCSVNYVLS